MNNGAQLVIEGDEVRILNNIGRAVLGNDSCARCASKRGYHHHRLYFLDAI